MKVERKEPDYYEILGVSPDATSEEIESAWKKVRRTSHPDAKKSESDKRRAEAYFRLSKTAYDTLKDADKRKAYDESKRESATPPQAPTPPARSPQPTHSAPTPPPQATAPPPTTARSVRPAQQVPRHLEQLPVIQGGIEEYGITPSQRIPLYIWGGGALVLLVASLVVEPRLAPLVLLTLAPLVLKNATTYEASKLGEKSIFAVALIWGAIAYFLTAKNVPIALASLIVGGVGTYGATQLVKARKFRKVLTKKGLNSFKGSPLVFGEPASSSIEDGVTTMATFRSLVACAQRQPGLAVFSTSGDNTTYPRVAFTVLHGNNALLVYIGPHHQSATYYASANGRLYLQDPIAGDIAIETDLPLAKGCFDKMNDRVHEELSKKYNLSLLVVMRNALPNQSPIPITTPEELPAEIAAWLNGNSQDLEVNRELMALALTNMSAK